MLGIYITFSGAARSLRWQCFVQCIGNTQNEFDIKVATYAGKNPPFEDVKPPVGVQTISGFVVFSHDLSFMRVTANFFGYRRHHND